MKLASGSLLAVLSLLVLPAAAQANHAGGEAPTHDLVSGTGHIETGPIEVHFHVNAMSGPGGQDPRGTASFRGNPPPIGELEFHARVTCLNAVGNSATVGLSITRLKTGPPVGTGALFSVDGGEPGAGVDRFEGFPMPVPPAACPPPFGGRQITSGNLVVHDASG